MGRARGGRLLPVLAALFVALLLISGCAAEGEDEQGSPVPAEEPEAPMEDKEKAALYAAIGSFVGKAWNGSGLFPDPCGQTPIQGVSCDLFNGVWYPTVVSIGPVLDNSLQCAPDARFGPQLFDLRRLKSLTFYACFPAANPTTIPAASWDKLSGTLETLEFRSNPGLSGAIPASLGRLASLRSLVLVDNNLTGAVPSELGGLAKLRRLVLSGNGLSGPVPATLGGLKGLLKMDLSNNRLDGRIPPELAGLESLTLLDLRNNSLTGGLPDFVLAMPALQDLLLSSNPLLGGTLMQRGWEKMASLATLDLSNVGLAGAIPESMAAMPRLRFLALDHNRLSGTVPAKLAALPSIGAMYLNGNNLTGALEFSARFYQRMGSRFASWDNPGLCTAETAGGAPTGVAVCKDAQDPPRVGVRDGMDGGGRRPEASSSLPASSSSSAMVAVLWWSVLAQGMAMATLRGWDGDGDGNKFRSINADSA
ncbi:piriformospora indica-insensitive protein 2-like isoform X2 [Triticum dicoccoides]|uniref:piriformospora indica-insensitive protein 2-like isoform X2 n=1 Tax=Triticum dicoccoides TaxID=85692 RepID=UPI0018902C43|nr:piriformospora indica-insensitive protein 2-like isoform X2 [Triticum dicoccoides]